MIPIYEKDFALIPAIAALSSLAGCTTTVVLDSFNPGIASDLFWTMFFSIIMFFFIFVGSAVLGLIIHLFICLLNFPSRFLLLPFFPLVSFLVGPYFSSPDWGYYIHVNVSVSLTAWLLYSFGPLRVWSSKEELET